MIRVPANARGVCFEGCLAGISPAIDARGLTGARAAVGLHRHNSYGGTIPPNLRSRRPRGTETSPRYHGDFTRYEPSGSFFRGSNSGRLQPFAGKPLLHLVDVDDVFAFDGRVFRWDDHADSGVDRIGAAGQHLV